MEDDIFDNLPDDPEKAFATLEAHFRGIFEDNTRDSDQSSTIEYYQSRFMTAVIAAAKHFDIEGIKDYDSPSGGKLDWKYYQTFDEDLHSILIQIKLRRAQRRKQYSVFLSQNDKEKIRHYINQIKEAIDKSNLDADKKDAIYKRLSELELEIDRDRTRFEILTDKVRAIARLSGEAEREGLRPYWHWIMLIFGQVDAAKEAEKRNLPAPQERKRLEPPRKELPQPSGDQRRGRFEDDDIPF